MPDGQDQMTEEEARQMTPDELENHLTADLGKVRQEKNRRVMDEEIQERFTYHSPPQREWNVMLN